MIRLRCPTGCSGTVPRPYALRTEPVRCANCTAWFRADARLEDGGLATGELVAAPGEPPPRASRGPRRDDGRTVLLHFAAAALIVGGLVEIPLGTPHLLLGAGVCIAWIAGRRTSRAR
jgi:hypothetical protein